MAILAFLTLFTAQSIQKALQNKSKIQDDIDRYSAIRDALRVMESDINKAFNYRDINIELYNNIVNLRNKTPDNNSNPEAPKSATGKVDPIQAKSPFDPNTTNNSPETLKPRMERIVTQFLGESNKLDFTTLSYARVSAEERTSDQAKIGYFLKDCRSWKNRTKTSRCLYRRISYLLDDDVTKGGEETPLLENVTKLEFQYLGPVDPTTWVKSWFTNARGDDRTKGVFPYAVEITLEVENKTNPKTKPIRMTLIASIRNPNNPDKKNSMDPTGAITNPNGDKGINPNFDPATGQPIK